MSEIIETVQFRRLFIGNMNYNSTEESLKSHFEKWGEIVNCFVKRDSHTGKSKGFGFITYKRAHMVDDAQAARPHIIDGRKVRSKRAAPQELSGMSEAEVTVNRLFVSSIKDDLGEEDLREYFGLYGNIVSVKFFIDKNTGLKRRDFAFVEFDDYDPVDKIVLQSHNYKGRKLEVKKCLPRKLMEIFKMKKEMGGFGRGGGAGGTGEFLTPNEFHRGACFGYGGCYRNGYGGGYGTGGGGWGDSFRDSYFGGGVGGWGGGFGSSHRDGYMRGITGYSQRSRRPYGGGRGSGGYGRP